ncbi:MAG TPA: SAM-dependent chlorinase/fluorinase, partial [Vicinamibacterales bacterium]|nr:SAM-dependent chlorinase/fluorinase [Vicinamibacterales bacterium]
MARPVIALLTDFGTRDHYAGTMKGVALSVCPDAVLVDITHDIAAHDVLAGALELVAAYRYFPPGTVFLVVVDPGVGSARRGIAADAGDYRFVAPDNGVLTAVLDEHQPRKVVELTERRYARPTVSRTFEGRDRFAPAAGWLAKGLELSALGRAAGALQRLEIPVPAIHTGGDTVELIGQVLRVDRFGNLVTNIDRKDFDRLAGAPLDIRIGDHHVTKVVTTYADAAPGEVCALFGSTDHLEIAANGASAAAALAVGR